MTLLERSRVIEILEKAKIGKGVFWIMTWQFFRIACVETPALYCQFPCLSNWWT